MFLVNVPMIAGALIAGHFLSRSRSNPDNEPLDVLGALLSIVGMVALVYAIIEGPNNGWGSAATLADVRPVAVAFVAFFSA